LPRPYHNNAGRNLFDVPGADTIAQVMAELRRRCNNNGEIDASGISDFSGLQLGDLSAIPAERGVTAHIKTTVS